MKVGDRFEFEGVTYELHPNLIQLLTEESNCEGCELNTKDSDDCLAPDIPVCGSWCDPSDQQFLFKRVPNPTDPRQLNLFEDDHETR